MLRFKGVFVTSFIVSSVLHSSVSALGPALVNLLPDELRTVNNFASASSDVGQRRFDSVGSVDQQKSGSGYYTAAVPYPGGSDFHQLNYGEEQKKGATYYNEGVGRNRGEVGFYGNTGHRGASGRVATDAYAGNHNKAKGDAIQSGYFKGDHGVHKGHDTGHSVFGDGQYDKNGQAQVQYGVKGGHKKGHHSSGFKNSYYKDESANNSRFYDDDNDEGGHYIYDSRGGAYHNNGGDKYHDRHHDGLYDSNDRSQQGHFGSLAGYDNAQRHSDHRAKDNFYDNLDYGHVRGGANLGENVEGRHQKQLGGVSYHKTNSRIPSVYHGRQEYWHPAMLGAYASPLEQYNYKEDRNYYPIASYITEQVEPFGTYYKDEYQDNPLSAIHGTQIKGKGYAYYEDTPLSTHYYD